MKNLTNSIILLLGYLFLVLGLAQIRYFETHILYFEAAFFIIMTVAVFAGLVRIGHYRLPLYGFLLFWAIVYVLTWQIYWRTRVSPPAPSEIVIQFLLVEVAAGLAHSVGSHLAEFDLLFDSLSSSTYPNRTLQMRLAGDRIQTEITRSRRYTRPLSVLILKLQRTHEEQHRQKVERLERDLFRRFALAKVGQIIDGHARQTDLIMRDDAGRFVILCPETDSGDCAVLAERIRCAVEEDLGDSVAWGIASFPEETLEFYDLLEKASQNLSKSTTPVDRPVEETPVGRPAG